MRPINWQRIILVVIMMLAATAVKADVADWRALTLNAEFGNLRATSSVVLGKAIYLIAGINSAGEFSKEVWRSYNGIEWTALTKNAEIGNGLIGAGAVVYKNKIYLIGGLNNIWDWNDHVYSSVDGINWVDMGTPIKDMVPNSILHGALVEVFNDKIYIVSGGGYGFKSKDVYSFDGTDWAVVTRNAEFNGMRNYNGTGGCVFDNKLWLIDGKEVWYTENGHEWKAATLNAEFTIAVKHNVEVLDGKMYIIGNYNEPNALWYSSDGIEWVRGSVITPGAFDFSANTLNGHIVFMGGINAGGQPLKSVYMSISSADGSTPTSIPTRTPTPYYTRTATPTRTSTNTLTATPSATPTRTQTKTFTATGTFTVIVTFTSTPTATETHTVSPTNTPTDTITETWTISETPTDTPTATVTLTPTPIETIILWHAENAGYGAPNDTTIAWRQYPDTESNKVEYTLYLENITEATEPKRIIAVPNEDDLEPSEFVFAYVVQGLTGGDCYSVTVTAQGGYYSVYEFSNNIVICPEVRTQLDVMSVKTPVPIAGTTGGSILPYDGAIVNMDWMHRKEHACAVANWDYYAALSANTSDIITIVNPPGTTWHWRGELTSANGIAWMTPYGGSEMGSKGTTLNAFFFGACAALDPVPKLYYNANTLTAGTQTGSTLATGGTDAGTPSGSKSGRGVASGIDWFATYGSGVFYLKLNAGASATKVWLNLEAYED